MLIPTVIAIVVIPVVVSVHQHQAAEIYDDGTPILALVVARLDSSHVQVAMHRPSETPVDVLARAPARRRVIGRLYPAHVDRNDPQRVRLDSDRYNATEPLLWLLVWVVVVGLSVFPLVRWHRRARALEDADSWCWGQLTVARHQGTVRAGTETGWAVAARVNVDSSRQPTAVWVAGSLDPGAPLLFAGPVAALGPPAIFNTPPWRQTRRRRFH